MVEVDTLTQAQDGGPSRGFDRLSVALATMLDATRALQRSSARIDHAAAELDIAAHRLLAALTPLAPMSRV